MSADITVPPSEWQQRWATAERSRLASYGRFCTILRQQVMKHAQLWYPALKKYSTIRSWQCCCKRKSICTKEVKWDEGGRNHTVHPEPTCRVLMCLFQVFCGHLSEDLGGQPQASYMHAMHLSRICYWECWRCHWKQSFHARSLHQGSNAAKEWH